MNLNAPGYVLWRISFKKILELFFKVGHASHPLKCKLQLAAKSLIFWNVKYLSHNRDTVTCEWGYRYAGYSPKLAKDEKLALENANASRDVAE